MRIYLAPAEMATVERSDLVPGVAVFQVDVALENLLMQLVLAPDFGAGIMKVIIEQMKADTTLREWFRGQADFDKAWESGWAEAAEFSVELARELLGIDLQECRQPEDRE